MQHTSDAGDSQDHNEQKAVAILLHVYCIAAENHSNLLWGYCCQGGFSAGSHEIYPENVPQ